MTPEVKYAFGFPLAAASDDVGRAQGLRHAVRRLYSYHLEEPDLEGLIRNWRSDRAPSGSVEGEESAAASCLLEIGIRGGTEEAQDTCAHAVAALVSGEALSWEALTAALAPLFGGLAEVRLDAPCAERFIAMLLARLLLLDNSDQNFDLGFLQAAPGPEKGNMIVWNLLLGALQRVHEQGGKELVQRVIGRRILSTALRTSGDFSRRKLAKRLSEEGLVP
jgi:hypothetical protein